MNAQWTHRLMAVSSLIYMSFPWKKCRLGWMAKSRTRIDFVCSTITTLFNRPKTKLTTLTAMTTTTKTTTTMMITRNECPGRLPGYDNNNSNIDDDSNDDVYLETDIDNNHDNADIDVDNNNNNNNNNNNKTTTTRTPKPTFYPGVHCV